MWRNDPFAESLLLSWWIRPLNGANGSRFAVLICDHQGIVPIGYTLFAVARGVFAGTVTRKVMPAMATTLVGFLAVRLLVAGVARPHFRSQLQRTFPVRTNVEPNQLNGDWIIRTGIYDSTGAQVAANQQRTCVAESPSPSPTPAPTLREGCEEGLYNLQVYQPGSRFWLFQTIETGIFLGLALVLVVLAVHRVRRRISRSLTALVREQLPKKWWDASLSCLWKSSVSQPVPLQLISRTARHAVLPRAAA